MPARRWLLAAVLAVAAAWARPAAAKAELGLGADWLVDSGDGSLMLTLAPETAIARHLTIGARFGAMLVSGPAQVGAPLDVRLRARFPGVYLDFLGGPWIFFDQGDPVRLHGAIGFGILRRDVSFGLEVGWVHPTSIVGVRLAFPLG